jgi:hypothetical protein
MHVAAGTKSCGDGDQGQAASGAPQWIRSVFNHGSILEKPARSWRPNSREDCPGLRTIRELRGIYQRLGIIDII